jgi:3-isopropylmalate dehydrogenase
MSKNQILVLAGDGVGPEVIKEALKVLKVVEEGSSAGFQVESALFGGCSIDANGVAITNDVLEKAIAADAVLAGAVGGPKWCVTEAHYFALTGY